MYLILILGMCRRKQDFCSADPDISHLLLGVNESCIPPMESSTPLVKIFGCLQILCVTLGVGEGRLKPTDLMDWCAPV